MSILPKWRFKLVDSADMTKLGFLDVSDRNVNLVHNAAGTAGFRMSMDNQYAKNIWPYTAGVVTQRWSPTTNLWTDKWSGYVSDIDEDYDTEMMTVTVVGWLQWLEERILRVTKDYTSVNPSTGTDWLDWEIIRDILLYANQTTIPVPGQADYVVPTVFKDSDGVTLRTLPLQWGGAVGAFTQFGNGRKGWPADRGTQLLEIVKRLCEVENGCDIRVDPVTRKLYVYDKKMTVRPNVQYGFRRGARNIKNFRRRLDTSSMKNYFEALGPANLTPQYSDTKGFPNPVVSRMLGMPAYGENSMNFYGLMEDSANISDAKNGQVLATYSAQEVYFNSTARLLYDITPLPFVAPDNPGQKSNIPEPFEDFEVGDQVYVSAERAPRLFINQQGMRTFNMNVSIDNDSNSEVLSALQVSAS